MQVCNKTICNPQSLEVQVCGSFFVLGDMVLSLRKENGMMVLIRKIQEEDYKAAAMIWREVIDVPVSDEDLAQIYRKMAADDRCFTYVAEADEKIVGLVTGVCVPAIPFPNGYIKMNGLGVIPEYRHRGIGRKLLMQVEKEAAQRQVSRIGLATGMGRTEAHAFYERMGYRKTSFWYRKDPVSNNENISPWNCSHKSCSVNESNRELLAQNQTADYDTDENKPQGGFIMETREILKELREKHQLTQEELAERVLVTRQAVSRWETGETLPNTETLKLLSREYDVSINTLLGSPRQLLCQCCGMPLNEDWMISREPDGFFNEDYCKWCYADGKFTYQSKDALLNFLIEHMPNPEGLDAEDRRSQYDGWLSGLKHWQ